jgi:hypothetical protein
VSILTIAIICVAVCAVAIYAISLGLMGWLYSAFPPLFPIRVILAAAIVGGFYAFWCSLEAKAPGKYDTIFNFAAYETEDIDSFEAIRMTGELEKRTTYTRQVAGRRAIYVDETGVAFRKSSADGAAVALLIPEKGKEEPVRYEAVMETDPRDKTRKIFPAAADTRWKEVKGRRYMEESTFGLLYTPRSGLLVIGLLLNLFPFVLWTLVLWLIVQYEFWHAFGIGSGFAALFLLVIVPVLFQKTRKERKIEPPVVTEKSSALPPGLRDANANAPMLS